jgi:hypothetical protein
MAFRSRKVARGTPKRTALLQRGECGRLLRCAHLVSRRQLAFLNQHLNFQDCYPDLYSVLIQKAN